MPILRRENDVRELSRAIRKSEEHDSRDMEVSSEEIDIVVAHLKRLTRSASLEFALRVGAVIIHHFYGGNTEGWRSRGPKSSSFRRLAEHPDLPLSAGSLYRCVALYELCDRLHAPSRWEHLGASHLRLVLGLPPSTQEKLLATANAKRWTVKTLQQEVLIEAAGRRTKGGRRPQPLISKSLMSLKRCVDESRHAIHRVADLTPQDLEHSMQLIEETRSSLEHLSQCLHAAIKSANDS